MTAPSSWKKLFVASRNLLRAPPLLPMPPKPLDILSDLCNGAVVGYHSDRSSQEGSPFCRSSRKGSADRRGFAVRKVPSPNMRIQVL